MGLELKSLSILELLRAYGQILDELLRRGVVRTKNSPVGDYAEYLVRRALGGTLAPNSEKSYDLLTAAGRRVQVKCRVAKTQLSPFRSFAFDEAAIVLLRRDFTVERGVLVPSAQIQVSGRMSEHVNGRLVHARPALLDHPENKDITLLLRQAAE